ncbi:hypothetical protein GCM10010251_00030 [Streptomyces aurantiogriseus]|uniref:Uncharacterized protein n=1 Tax=Streptomyces aurantiogriseus TaxID=66870 RepID=A0A918EYA1_9ACTN|nr:hypothetical protein GCM10010251_00030 [Streptomyces aurantiogriseus]
MLAERIDDTLSDLSWRMWPTSRHTLLYVSRDGLRGAEWIVAAYPFELGGLPVAWQLGTVFLVSYGAGFANAQVRVPSAVGVHTASTVTPWETSTEIFSQISRKRSPGTTSRARPAKRIRPLTWYFPVRVAGFEPTTSSPRTLGWVVIEVWWAGRLAAEGYGRSAGAMAVAVLRCCTAG